MSFGHGAKTFNDTLVLHWLEPKREVSSCSAQNLEPWFVTNYDWLTERPTLQSGG